MTKILFSPGCYGHYWARCIYSYTNLRKSQYRLFDFDNSGSSHSRQFINESKNCIELGHVDTLEITQADTVVVVLPEQNHRLDYYDNQYHKSSKKTTDCFYIVSVFDRRHKQKTKRQLELL